MGTHSPDPLAPMGFKKILIANRGEIALRVIRSCREMGISTVAVYSEADRTALHVRMAKEAYAIGPAPARESYLRIDKLIDAAKKSGADAVHPGYGFLSENAQFAQACADAKIAFIGPKPATMTSVGDKIEAKRAAKAADVPIVPGLIDPIADTTAAASEASKIGYPVVLKAAAGGGGRGIRVVKKAEEFESAFRTASGEAKAAFNDGRLYLEKYLDRPRHIEVQIVADTHGNVVAFCERECSIQRRHQKLIEETPSPVITEKQRAELQAAAARIAKQVGYVNAGTVEFLYAAGKLYFIEVNARLQVEHPITEAVTGIDLVREQIRIAQGERLSLRQEQTAPRGHSIEVRVNAEDPTKGFVPSTGTIGNLRFPGGAWVRIDSALYRGQVVTPYYDSMLAKAIVWAQDREGAIVRMERALREFYVGGVRTGVPYALRILNSPEFRKGEFDTHFLERFQPAGSDPASEEAAAIVSSVHRHLRRRRRSLKIGGAEGSATSPWAMQGRLDRLRGRVR